PRPVSGSGVMFGIAWSSGPFGLPPRNRLLSVAIVIVRGVWHSPQWATARTRYSPRGTPAAGADGGGVSRGANAASQAGRNTDSKNGTVIRLRWLARFTGGTEDVASAGDLLLAGLRRGGVGANTHQRHDDGTGEQDRSGAGTAHRPTNPLPGPPVPAGGGRGGRQTGFHDQRVLAGVVVVA